MHPSQGNIVKSILSRKEGGIFVFRVDARFAQGVKFITWHTTVYAALAIDTRDVGDASDGGAVLAIRSREAVEQRNSTTSAAL